MDAGELALLDNRNDMFGGGGGAFFWVFALLLLSGGGFGNFGGPRGPMPDVATKEFVQDSVNNQAVQTGLRDILLSSANNNYETAQLIMSQSNQMLQQNNTNLINVIQGFNQLGSKIDQLGYHMDQCCCEIKTQMLQNRLDDAQAALVAAQGNISNANQSQYILSQLGRFVAWTPSGSQAAAGT
jgi:hypothetical protein